MELKLKQQRAGGMAYHISENDGKELESREQLVPLSTGGVEGPGTSNARGTTQASTSRQSRFHIEDAPHDRELDNRSNYIGYTDA